MDVVKSKCKTCCRLLRKGLFCTFIWTLGLNPVFAVQVKPQSLQEKFELADQYKSTHREKFNQLLNELAQEQTIFDKKHQLYFSYLQGYQRIISGDLSAAISKLDHVIQQDEEIYLKHRAIITKVNIYTTTENYQEGFVVLNQMLPMLEQMTDRDNFHQALFVVSMFYNRLAKYELSKKYVNQMLDSYPTPRFQCLATMLKTEASYRLQQLTEREIDKINVEQCKQENEHIASGAIISFIARWHYDHNRPALGLRLIQSDLADTENTQYYLLITTYYSLIAKGYFLLGDNQQAEQFALKVIEESADFHKSEAILESAQLLYLINKTKGDAQQALFYHEKYHQHHQLINEDKVKRNVSYQIAQQDNRDKAHEIRLLAEKNKRLNVEKQLFEQADRSKRLQILLLMLAICGLLYWAYRSYRAQNRLKDIADHDELTGIFNRRCFQELAEAALQYCSKTYQPVSLLMFDIDHFKNINDQYGHAVGDWALVKTIEVCKSLCRKNDIIGRFGGEEFTILLPGCDHIKAKDLAETYRSAIAGISTMETGYDFQISASFGVFSSKQGRYSLHDVIKGADCAMYHSKRHGRNRVSVYGIDVTRASAARA